MLCQQCRSLFSDSRVYGWNDRGTENHTLTLRPDCASYCRLCAILLDRLKDDQDDNEANAGELKVKFWFRTDGMFLYGSYYLHLESIDDQGETRTEFRLLLASLDNKDDRHDLDMPPWHRLSKSTSSAQSLSYADKWLRDCVKKHDCCRNAQNASKRRLPKRLVYVDRSNKKPKLRLFETRKAKSKKIQYITLSHCWGSLKITRLLKSNYNEFLTDIPLDSLPRVFQDAIYIGGRAGINYIWIDSLCIIQDSVEDWNRESNMMDIIYRHGYCNIAATGFPDGSNGLFASREPSLLEPIEYCMENDVYCNASKVIQKGRYLLIDYEMWEDGVDRAPLNGRGWVMQERRLSPRTIHFGSHQIFWECVGFHACELFPDGYPSRMPTAAFKFSPLRPEPERKNFFDEIMETCESPPEDDDTEYSDDSDREFFAKLREEARESRLARRKDFLRMQEEAKEENRNCTWGYSQGHEQWRRFIQQFSQCKLTKPEDKLVAVSGVAKDFKDYMKCDYLSGLWRKDLEHQLIWKVLKPEPLPKVEGHRGPSWSWSSVDGKCELPQWDKNPDIDGTRFFAQIISAETTPIGSDEFGFVSGGRLEIQGHLLVFKIPPHRDSRETLHEEGLEEVEWQARLFWDTREWQKYYKDISFTKVLKHAVLNSIPWRQEEDDGSLNVFFMPIRSQGMDPDFSTTITLAGLLLSPILEKKGHYQRIGLCEFGQSMQRDPAKWAILEAPTAKLDSNYYDSVDDESRYTITIA